MIRNVRSPTLVGEITVFDGIALPHHQSFSISRYPMSPNKWITIGTVLFAAALCAFVALLVRVFG